MAIYLETNSLRKITHYECEKGTYTSIFSIFELLAGMTSYDFKVRKACLHRIAEQALPIKTPMIDAIFCDLLGCSDYNKFASDMIKDIYIATLNSNSFEQLEKLDLDCSDSKGIRKCTSAFQWLRNWDLSISNITNNISSLFEEKNASFVKNLYNSSGLQGLARYYWAKFYEARIDNYKLSHAEAFVGSEEITCYREEVEKLFSKYNYRLFMTAQAAILAKSYFINGGTYGRNDPSDLLHLLYLEEGDVLVSNDKIFREIKESCDYFNLKVIENETSLSELFLQN